MNQDNDIERVETVVIGGGQAGLATGYYLRRRGRQCVILDANARIGDSWRKRWDSLRLFTPAKLSHLPGMRYPGRGWAFPSKDEFADYLEAYAGRFELDVRHGMRADSIRRSGDRYEITTGERRFEAEHVVLATGSYQEPKLPVFAPELDPTIVQVHSSAYRNPAQLRDGRVLVVGAANSGAEIALELAATHEVWLAGRAVMVFPVRPGSLPSRLVMPAFLQVATHVLTRSTPLGRRLHARTRGHGAPLIRVKPGDLAAAGVRRVPRVSGVHGGRPQLEDGRVIEVENVLWCTGFRADFSWIDMSSFSTADEPQHERGVVSEEPGMYLVGQHFQHALSSSFIGGVGRDAEYIAGVIATRARARERAARGRIESNVAGSLAG